MCPRTIGIIHTFRREVAVELKKLVGGVLAAVFVLWIVGWTNSRSQKPDAPQVVQASQADKWHVTEDKSPMDDSKTVILTLDSDDEVQGPLGSVRPSLIVRCKEKKTDVYVATGMAASVEEYGPAHKVGIRRDGGTAQYYDWLESTDHRALFASDLIWGEQWDSTLGMNVTRVAADSGGRIEFAKQLATASKLTFQFTPFDGSPQVAGFDVRGLDPHLHKVAEACGWAY
jgi:type VI secretion system protein VasI